MIAIRYLVAIQVFLTSPFVMAAAPSNDAFAGATVVGPTLPVTLIGDAREATYQSGEPILDSESRNGSIWFKWVPTAAGTGFAVPAFTWEAAGATTPGSGFEMFVHRGTSVDALTVIARGDETEPIVRFAFAVGQTYYIQVFVQTSTTVATFPWKLVVTSIAAPPIAPSNDAFASATTIATGVPRTASGTTVAATIESGESIDNNLTRSVWYKYTSNANINRLFTLTPDADSSPKAEIFTGTGLTDLTRVGWIDFYGETLIPLVNGTIYYIRVFDDENNDYSIPGAFSLDISAAPAGAVPSNDAFANATDLGSALDVASPANTLKSGVESGERLPMGTTGTVWFKWTAPAAGWFSVSAESEDYPPGLSVWAGSTLADLKLKGSSDSFIALTDFKVAMGETVYFQACGEGGYFYLFNIKVSVATNPELPRLISAALSSGSVDVTSAAQTVTVSLNIEGPATGFIDSVYILHPNGGVADYALTADLTQTSGTPGNGVYAAILTIPRGAAPGSYPLVVYLQDGTATDEYVFASTRLITERSPLYYFWTTYADIPSGPDFLTVTNTGTADAVPSLTSFTVTPATANLGTVAATFTFSAVLTDTQGITFVSVDWNDPAGILLSDTVNLIRTGGTALNGTWTGTLTVPQYANPGRIDLTLLVSDTIGQSRQFGIQPGNFGLRDRFYGRLQNLPNSFITLNNSVGLDHLPPQISEVTITPFPATFGSGGTVDLAVSVRAKDAQTGTDEVYFALDANRLVILPRISGNNADGIYGGTVTIRAADSSPGVHVSLFATYDLRGNEGLITSAVPGISQTTLLAPAAGTYNAWAFGYGLTSPRDAPSATAQADGISNALKFAFHLNPTESVTGAARTLTPGTGLAGLPSITQIGSGPTTRLRLEYIRRTAAPGLSYTVEFGSNLAGASAWTPVTGGTVTDIDTQWQRVVIEDVTGAGSPVRFGRVKIVTIP